MNLTHAAKLTRQGLTGGAILLFVFIVGWLGYRYYLTHIYVPPPPVEVKPDIKFGVLPKLKLPESTSSASNYSYTLDTPTGSLPSDIPKFMKVYFSPSPTTTLLALDRATKLAHDLNFSNGPRVISPIEYRFLDQNGGELIINLNTGNLHFKRAGFNLEDIEDSDKKIATDFKNFLSSKGLLAEDLRDGPVKVTFSEDPPKKSQTALISLWPQNLEDYPIVTSSFETGYIQALITNAHDDLDKYLKFDYIYWSISQKTFATYPIKNAQQAFDELKSGAATVIKAPNVAKVSINSVYLAYFQSNDYTPYLQPVYVFRGEGFVAYLAAIIKQYTE